MKPQVKASPPLVSCAGEKGATLIEYCFTVWLVAVVVIATVAAIGNIVSNHFSIVP